jgi:molecular chaperone DnaK (HSP70)
MDAVPEGRLGIDLGTTTTTVAVSRGGRLLIPDLGRGSAALPTAVLLDADGTLVLGEPALREAPVHPSRVARAFVRRIGDPRPIFVGGAPFPAEVLVARVLGGIVDRVTDQTGAQPSRIAVTYPAHWGPYKVDLLTQAVRLAGVKVERYVTGLEAAALAYAHRAHVPVGSLVAVYDLGGGIFDTGVVRRTDSGFDLLGEPEGIDHLGGIDFDQAIQAHVVTSLRDANRDGDVEGFVHGDPGSAAGLCALGRACADAKERLSTETEASVPVRLPTLRGDSSITRSELESLLRPSIVESVTALQRAVRSAGIESTDLEAVLLVGGSSRMPLVARLVGDELGRPVTVHPDPEGGLAVGAALAAGRR